jgi:hypothetical protein
MRASMTIIAIAVVSTMIGCRETGRSRLPTEPSSVMPSPGPTPPPSPVSLVVFTDPTSRLSTSDMRDADEQIVRFNTAGELIWAADESRHPGYPVRGAVIRDGSLEVRFGTKDGERRAYVVFSTDYYHYPPPPTVVDFEVIDGRVQIIDNKPPVPLPSG